MNHRLSSCKAIHAPHHARMLRFSLFGFPVAIQWMFWVMLAILGGGLRADVNFMGLVLWILAGFISILIHELGHTFLQRRFGARAQILLYSFGGLAIPDRNFTRGQDIIVSLAGPVVQIILGFVAWEVVNAMHPVRLDWGVLTFLSRYGADAAPPTVVFMACMAVISIFWGLINLVPIFPLDGGHIMRGILGPRNERMAYLLGMICALGLAIYMAVVWKSLWNTILFGLLAWDNFQRYQGQTPPAMMRP